MCVYRNGSGPERLLEFGCTCTCAMVQGRSVVLANVGDSVAVIGSDTGEHPLRRRKRAEGVWWSTAYGGGWSD